MMHIPPTSSIIQNDTGDIQAFVRSGDRDALERVLVNVAPQAYAQAWRCLGNQADAEDAVQDACIALMHSIHRYDPAIPFPAWFGRLVQISCWR